MYKTKYEIVRKYYKYVDTSFTPPTLTAAANGAMGGPLFGVSASSTYGSYQSWYVFDGVTGGYYGWISMVLPCYLDIYNPDPIKITNIEVVNMTNTAYGVASGYISVSDDGTNWTQIAAYTNNETASIAHWNIDLSDNTGYHKYYRLGVSTKPSSYVGIGELYLTAYTRGKIESTSSDYDSYEDIPIYKTVIKNNNYYCLEG